MKKLTKSQNNRVLTGTLAGIADYFGIDPTIARVIFVFSIFFLEGAPILLYLLLMFLVPKAENHSRGYEQPYEYSSSSQAKQAEAVADDAWSDF
ncbi:PspC domain-containing protein [Enterococcus sp.]|uniref:PspC domain-containing protein n=1 Tax=Enterococcus sp. TaxID=35783 RepID=UPI002910B62D|nr:PspC domain-containing protein [Enterococcus sp.]MDU5333997.1 PspC domain-containing protein [Enterococcus sp.]